jgi:hypothetical protein
VENLDVNEIRSPDRPARSESPYLLSHPGHGRLGNATRFTFALGAEMSKPAKYKFSFATSSLVTQLNGYPRSPPIIQFTVLSKSSDPLFAVTAAVNVLAPELFV